MTNAEAIKTLHELWRETNDSWYEEVYGKAIKALEAQDSKTRRICDTCKHNSTSNKKWPCVDCDMREPADRWDPKEAKKLDAISRQAAIDILDAYQVMVENGEENPYAWARLRMSELPPAQPEKAQLSGEDATFDCVSRQAAIEAVEILLEQTEEDADVKTWNNAIRGAINSIKHHVSSAQPEPIRINLNEPIKVKLTDWGKEIYYHQYDRTNQIAGREICKPRFPREDENGYTEFQLWCFIELYGMHMGMTLPNVIEPLEIVYER